MNEIRKKAEQVDGLRSAWLGSVQLLQQLLEERLRRMTLKGEPLKSFPPADDDVVEQIEARVTLIDNTIAVGKYQQQNLSHSEQYRQFLRMYILTIFYKSRITKKLTFCICKIKALQACNIPNHRISCNKQISKLVHLLK